MDNMSTSNYYPGLSSSQDIQQEQQTMQSVMQPPVAASCTSPMQQQIRPHMQQQTQQNNEMYYNASSYMQNVYAEDSSNQQQQFMESQKSNENVAIKQYQSPQPTPPAQPSYYEATFHPPSTSQYFSHYYTPMPLSSMQSTSSSQGYSTNFGQAPWYQPPAGGAQHEQMMNMLHFTNSNGREARNRAEKNRRDKLNGSIHELSTMVPHVAESPRRVDKTAVLRFSAHGLRIRHVFGRTLNSPPRVKPQFTDALMRLLDSFLLTITCRGQIVLVSPSVEQHLGHCQTDLFGQSILQITHPDDHALLKKLIIPTDLETLFDVQPEDENGEPRPRTQEEEDEIDRKLMQDKRNFVVRLAKAGPRSEPTTYELVRIDGCFRRADLAPRGVKASTFPTGLQLIRRARGRDDSIPLHKISGNDIVLVAMARVIKPPRTIDRVREASYYEYRTRHLIDGRIIQCDQRISLIAGYMTDEVNGLSPFTFMHQDDVRWVIVALRQMYDCNSEYGESCYRLLTRTGKFIYLKTRGHLEIDKTTNKVHSFVCINTLVSEEEGRKCVREMKNKFSIIINRSIPPSSIDAPAAENPHQLERAIIYLIQNLEKSNQTDDESRDGNDETESESSVTSKNHHLAIIPPKTCTVKKSIVKSIDVVNFTAAKSFKSRSSKSQDSPNSGDNDLSSDCDTDRDSCDGNLSRPSVLQKNNSCITELNNVPEISSPGSKNGIRIREDVSPDPNEVQIKEEVPDYEEDHMPQISGRENCFELDTFRTDMSSPGSYLADEAGSPSSYVYPESVGRPTSVLKRTRCSESYEDSSGNICKRRTIQHDFYISPSIQDLTNPSADLTRVLPNSFEAIDRSLLNIQTVTTELKGHCSAYPVDPSSQHELEEIIEEHQEQRELLENIQNEYQTHLRGSATTNVIKDEGSFNHQKEIKPR